MHAFIFQIREHTSAVHLSSTSSVATELDQLEYITPPSSKSLVKNVLLNPDSSGVCSDTSLSSTLSHNNSLSCYVQIQRFHNENSFSQDLMLNRADINIAHRNLSVVMLPKESESLYSITLAPNGACISSTENESIITAEHIPKQCTLNEQSNTNNERTQLECAEIHSDEHNKCQSIMYMHTNVHSELPNGVHSVVQPLLITESHCENETKILDMHCTHLENCGNTSLHMKMNDQPIYSDFGRHHNSSDSEHNVMLMKSESSDFLSLTPKLDSVFNRGYVTTAV